MDMGWDMNGRGSIPGGIGFVYTFMMSAGSNGCRR